MRKELISLVKDSILDFNDEEAINTILTKYPLLKDVGASFITLYLNGELRGCIGTINAYQPLYKDIINNAKLAAFYDDRFPPLTQSEFIDIDIEVSILTKPEKIKFRNLIDLKNQISNNDGIILKYKKYSATYLPSVWEDLDTFDKFFISLTYKAGIKESFFDITPTIYKYKVNKYEEKSRPMGVVNSFYSGNEKELETYFNSLNFSDIKPRALIVPHAGYIYSGKTADKAYSYIKCHEYKRVIVIGPCHHYYINNISGSFFNNYKTPLGNLKIDLKYLKELESKFNISFLEDAHRIEHSTEIQMPFIANYLNTKVIELIYSNPNNLTELILYLLKDKNNLLVISSDLSHFLPLQNANKIDMNCFNAIKDLNIDLLKNCEACGLKGIEGLINSSNELNLKSKVLEYRTSFETTGDESSVVGYLSAIIY